MDRVDDFLNEPSILELSDDVLPDGDLEVTAGFNFTGILWFLGLLGVGWLLWNYILKPEPKEAAGKEE